MADAVSTLGLDISGYAQPAQQVIHINRTLFQSVGDVATAFNQSARAGRVLGRIFKSVTPKPVAEGFKKLPAPIRAAAGALGVVGIAYTAHRVKLAKVRREQKQVAQSTKRVTAALRQQSASLAAGNRASALYVAGLGILGGVVGSYVANLKLSGRSTASWVKDTTAAARAAGLTAESYATLERALVNSGLGAEEARSRIQQAASEGKDFAALFENPEQFKGAMSTAAQQLGSQTQNLQKAAGGFALMSEHLARQGDSMRSFFLGLAAQVLPAANALFATIGAADLGGAGERFGKGLRNGLAVFTGLLKNGELLGAFKDVLIIAGKEFVNFLTGSFFGLAKGLASALVYSFKPFAQAMNKLVDGVAKRLAGKVEGALKPFLKPLGLYNEMREAGNLTVGSAQIKESTSEFSNAAGLASKSFKSGFDQGNRVRFFNAAADRERLAARFLRAGEAGAVETKKAAQQMAKLATGGPNAPKLAQLAAPTVSGAGGSNVIADSLARVGGGGGVAFFGNKIEDKISRQVEQGRQQIDLLRGIFNNTTGGGPAPVAA